MAFDKIVAELVPVISLIEERLTAVLSLGENIFRKRRDCVAG